MENNEYSKLNDPNFRHQLYLDWKSMSKRGTIDRELFAKCREVTEKTLDDIILEFDSYEENEG